MEQSKYISDDEYLQSIDGVMESIQDARNTPSEQGVSIVKLKVA
ncbi:MAG TPA: hypothetical protein PLV58_10380 [Campylobacterales bacterium]|nr:hypothetical protein [Campylobacterales bacterium]